MSEDKNNEKTIFEELVQQANQYTYGAHPNGRDAGKKLTLLDLLRVNAKDNDKAPQILPFQMNTFVESLGDLYVQVVEIQQMVAAAYKSSTSKDLERTKSGLVQINKNLQEQKSLIKKCSKIVDKLS